MLKLKLSALIFTIMFFILSTICSASQQFNVEVENVEKKTVSEFLLKDLVQRGFNILNTSEHQVSVRRDVDNFWGQVFFGSRFNSIPEIRAYFNLIQNGSSTRITAEARIVTNPNSGFENYTVVTNKEWQEYLDNVKKYFNGFIGYGIDWADKKKDDCLVITYVSPEGPADKAGIKVGDLISYINGSPVDDLSMNKIKEIFREGSMGTVIRASIKHPVKDKLAVLTKDFVKPVYKKPSPPITSKPIYGFMNGEIDTDGNMPIIAITTGSSAEKAGLKVGDRIIRVNGILVTEFTPESFRNAFDGPDGSKVELILVANAQIPERTVILVKKPIIQKFEL